VVVGGDDMYRLSGDQPCSGGGCLRHGTLQLVGVRERVADCADSRLAVMLK